MLFFFLRFANGIVSCRNPILDKFIQLPFGKRMYLTVLESNAKLIHRFSLAAAYE